MLSKENFLKNHSGNADDIVLSGISGRFPNSINVDEFARNLYNKVQLVDDKETRWKHTNPDVPKTIGKIDGLEKFDSTFFGIRDKAAMTTDPQGRVLLEESYQAVLDAGINPKFFRGSRTGVYLGCGSSESEACWFFNYGVPDGLALSGNCRSLLANRISFALNLTGPSMAIDTACSSSATALDLAVKAIKHGECDAALVAGVNLLLNDMVSFQFQGLGVLSLTGSCRPFDEAANGYVRSETICVILIQKRKDAKRCYATLEYTLSNCDGHKPEGIHFPNGDVQLKLLEQFYSHLNISPTIVDFLECHSTGTQVGDPQECRAIIDTFCPGRDTPLLVGSVKSNAGHAEAASAMVSIAKVIIAFENGKIPPNLNYDTPRAAIPALTDGRLQVVNEALEFKGSLVSINCFGFGGANSHMMLRIHDKVKNNRGIPKDKIPRLVVWSGRTEEAVEAIMDSLVQRPLDAEHVALLQNTQTNSLPFNIYKGYGLFTQNGDNENATCVQKGIQHYNGEKRPLVWCYSGMGSQWTTMGKELLNIPIFENAINKCHNALAKKGLNLKEIISSSDPKMFDNILHSFVGIAAIQIGITDVLKAIGQKPDLIIGHSVGELGCAYGDECCSAEEVILCAYSRGMVSLQTKVVFGSMAAVGLGYSQLKEMIPEGIEIACHNSFESSTISGPTENVKKFVAELKAKGIFAKEVASSNIPYHSSYIQDMGPKLLKSIKEILKEPRKRSEKWISSSVPQHLWNTEKCQFSSAEYHTNNLLSPVLFEEAAKTLPENSLIIEIAPHGLLQAILKRSHKDAIYVPLTQRDNSKNDQFLLSALGKIYMNGYDINLSILYPAVEFPVSRGTPMIAPHIKWDHSEDHFVPTTLAQSNEKSAERVLTISLNDVGYEYVEGHCIDGRTLFPATGYLYLAWETFTFIKGIRFDATTIEFEDVKFLRATTINKDDKVKFVVVIQPGTGRFEIAEGSESCVTGHIKMVEKVELTNVDAKRDDQNILPSSDFYKELRLRGYHYKNLFKSVAEANHDGTYGKIKWQGNWVAFLDNMLQIQILGKDSRSLVLPTGIQRITICPEKHFEIINKSKEGEEVFFEVGTSRELNMVRCGGVELANMKTSTVQRRRPPGVPVLESYQFISYEMSPIVDEMDAARIIMQLALENFPTSKVKGVEVESNAKKTFLSNIRDTLFDLPLITHDLTCLTSESSGEEQQIKFENSKLASQKDCYIVISPNNPELIEESCKSLIKNGFLVIRQTSSVTNNDINRKFIKLAVVRTENEFFVLYQHREQENDKTLTAFKITDKDEEFEWIEKARNLLKNGHVVLYAENEPLNGLIGLVNCLRREPIENSIQCVFIDDKNAPKFDLKSEFYQNQLKLDLGINVLRDGKWGSYRHLLIKQYSSEQPTRHSCYVNALVKSDLSSLKWLSSPICGDVKDKNFTRVQVHYASLNFKDVMLATGRISADLFVESRMEHECILGIEYSGINEDKKRVMGIAVSGALSTDLTVDRKLMWNCPDNWSLSEAATVPCVYGTVYYAFFMTTHIESGKSILIHAGTGGIGLAAIRVAFAYGLEVFTTVSTEEKKNFLLKEFPHLKAENIGNSRDTSFEKMIMKRTKGKGVDYVLNSLAEEKLLASIRCLGHLGKFLEIGKFDMEKDTKIGMSCFLKELSFHSVMLDKLFNGPDSMKMRLLKMIDNDIKSGVIKPLKTNIFPASQVEQAFRLLASGRHMGKVVVQVREKENDSMTLPIVVLPRVYCHPEYSYVIPGGLGGFGLELADWLVMRGCRKVVLSSSRGITKQYQAYRIKIWESYGVKVVVDTSDITTRLGCEKLLKGAIKVGPVGGIFNLAVLLRDGIFENQDAIKFKECMAPKAYATKYLDEVSRTLCPHLEYFVIFSSVSCGRGNAGQTNYGMANSVMEKIMEQRNKLGLPAKAIQWGAVGEVGIVADMQEESSIDMEIGGTLQQRISSCLEELDNLMLANEPLVSSMVVAEKKVVRSSKGNILETIIAIMGIRDMKSISLDTTLSELGMDSLMAVELKQLLERDFDINLSMTDLRALNFRKIIEYSKVKPGQEVEKSKTGKDKANEVFADILNNFGKIVISEKIIQCSNFQNKSRRLAILIPGMQGNASKFMLELCDQLNFSYCLIQYNKVEACYARTIDEIVNIIRYDIEEVLQGFEEFHIIGHSFGGLLAINLASVFEKSGIKGRVTVIDGSVKMFKGIVGNQGKNQSDEEFQNYVLAYLVSVFSQNVDRSKLAYLLEEKSWDGKCNKTLDLVLDLGYLYSKEDLRHCFNACYNRAHIMATIADGSLGYVKHSKCLFIRPTEVTFEHENESYDMNDYFEQSVDVAHVSGNHQTIVSNPKTAEILKNVHFKV